MFKTLASIACLLCVSAIAHAAEAETLNLEPIAVSLSTAGDLGEVDYKDDYQDCSGCSCKSKASCSCGCTCPIVPSMLGDTGLMIPRLQRGFVGVSPAFQNHIYKVAENNSAVPQNRVGFNFNFIPDVYNGFINNNQVSDDLFEYRFFAEKTLFNPRLSVDFMVPFYTTSMYDPGDSLLANGPQTDTAFGDLAFGFKYLLYGGSNAKFSGGVRIEAPTNEEITQTGGLNAPLYSSFSDDVWHFTPYVALLATPSDRFFVQTFVSYRLNSGPFDVTEPIGGTVAPVREQTSLMADLSLGYWIYRNDGNRGLTGIVPLLELHYTGAFDDESPANTENNLTIGKSDVLNLTAGVTALFNDRFSMTAGVAVPLRDNPNTPIGTNFTIGTDRRYDWALMVNMNYYFGR